MRTLPKAIGAFVLMLFAALASTSAMAQHGGHGYSHAYGHGHGHGYGYGGGARFGVTLGVPLYGPGYFWPYYDYPYPASAYSGYPYPLVVVQSSPPVYVEQGAAQAAPAQADWYYCTASNSYYPYVSECPAGWQRVPAQPPR
jgi:hypothetical protein